MNNSIVNALKTCRNAEMPSDCFFVMVGMMLIGAVTAGFLTLLIQKWINALKRGEENE